MPAGAVPEMVICPSTMGPVTVMVPAGVAAEVTVFDATLMALPVPLALAVIGTPGAIPPPVSGDKSTVHNPVEDTTPVLPVGLPFW